MRRCRSWYRIHQLLQVHLPLSPGPLADSLALWLQGTLLAENGCLDRVAAALAARGGNVHTLRRRLCDGLKDDAERQEAWGADQELDVETCFAPLLAWVLSWRVAPGPEPPPPLVLAVDPTHHADRLVALTVSVVLNQTAIPVAWRLVPAQASLSWMALLCRLLALLAPAVPPGMAVHVLCDRGLYSPRLWRRIRSLGWHPCLRCDPDLTFWPEGQPEARPAAAWGGGEGTLWVGRGVASPCHRPLPGTLVVLHGRGHEHPWVLLTDTPPDRTEVTLYACRDWIEQGFRGLKRAGWQWQRTRRTDPVRAGRHWLVLAVATLLAVAHGTRREEAAALGRPPARLRTPPATVPSRSTPRRLSLLRQGMACLGALLAQGRWWTRLWLRPRPGPYGPPAVRALAQGP